MGKSKLQRLFEQRQVAHEKFTSKLEEALLPVVIRASQNYYFTIHPEAIDRTIWTAFSMNEYKEKQMVSLFGKTTFVAGDEYTDIEGNYIASLNEQEAAFVTTAFQIVLPLDLCETGSIEDIMEHLATQDAKAEKKRSEIITKYIEEQEEQVDPIYNDTGLSDEEIKLAEFLAHKNKTIQ